MVRDNKKSSYWKKNNTSSLIFLESNSFFSLHQFQTGHKV